MSRKKLYVDMSWGTIRKGCVGGYLRIHGWFLQFPQRSGMAEFHNPAIPFPKEVVFFAYPIEVFFCIVRKWIFLKEIISQPQVDMSVIFINTVLEEEIINIPLEINK